MSYEEKKAKFIEKCKENVLNKIVEDNNGVLCVKPNGSKSIYSKKIYNLFHGGSRRKKHSKFRRKAHKSRRKARKSRRKTRKSRRKARKSRRKTRKSRRKTRKSRRKARK